MNKIQRDLLAACYNKKMKADYDSIHEYSAKFKKYDNLRMNEIDEVVDKLNSLYQKER